MAYATPAELRHWLRLPDPLTPDEEAQAALLLELAEGTVEEETGQGLEQSADTVTLDGPTAEDGDYQQATGSKRLVLPRWPVTAVTSVTLTGDDQLLVHGADRDYTWSAAGIITRRGAYWPAGDQVTEVVYTAGYSTIPKGVRRIVLRLAGTGWPNPGGALTAETLGDHSRTFSAEGLGMELSEADKRTLGAYRARTSS